MQGWFLSFHYQISKLAKNAHVDKLRWVTLGYHYDWTNKVYPEGCYSEFPTSAAEIFISLAQSMGHIIESLPETPLKTSKEMYFEFVPEAAIVNYYRKSTTMGFHIDQAELNKAAPLVSVR